MGDFFQKRVFFFLGPPSAAQWYTIIEFRAVQNFEWPNVGLPPKLGPKGGRLLCVPMRESNPRRAGPFSIDDGYKQKLVICQYSAVAVATVRYGFKETRLQRNTRQVFLEFLQCFNVPGPPGPVVPFVRNAHISTGK